MAAEESFVCNKLKIDEAKSSRVSTELDVVFHAINGDSSEPRVVGQESSDTVRNEKSVDFGLAHSLFALIRRSMNLIDSP